MPRAADPAVRQALIERAATMLARREPVTLRALVDGTGTSTMSVYTHFDGMPGLWRAVRQEGFTRLGARLATVRSTDDPVHDLVRLGGAYLGNALASPDLYRAMFDSVADLEDPAAADQGFQTLVACAARAREAGRFDRATDPGDIATRLWAFGHGLALLVLGGALPRAVLTAQVPPTAVALFVAAGDDPARCRESVRRAWAQAERELSGPGGA